MKKLISMCLISILVFVGCTQTPEIPQAPTDNNQLSANKDTYIMDLTLDTLTGTIGGIQKLNYTNDSTLSVSEIYLNLYPNTYANEADFSQTDLDQLYPLGFKPGNITINSIEIDDAIVEGELLFDGDMLRVPLSSPIEPAQSKLITIDFLSLIPNATNRWGHFEGEYNLTSFFPQVAVQNEDGTFVQNELSPTVGDMFFSEVADFEVNLTFPTEYTIAHTGVMVQEEHSQSSEGQENASATKTLKLSQKDVRDFAIVASPNFTINETTVGDTKIYAYAKEDEQSKLLLEYGTKAIEYYNATFGTYPYPTYSLVESFMPVGGMEYPGLVMITDLLFEDTHIANHYLEWVTVHETAHQWWYGLVGNDPIQDAFVDESLTEYSTYMYFRDNYSQEVTSTALNNNALLAYNTYNSLLSDEIIHKPTTEFTSNLDLSLVVYSKGLMMYLEMEQIAGEEALQTAIKEYYQSNIYGIADPEIQTTALMASSPDYDWDTFFNTWLYDK